MYMSLCIYNIHITYINIVLKVLIHCQFPYQYPFQNLILYFYNTFSDNLKKLILLLKNKYLIELTILRLFLFYSVGCWTYSKYHAKET